MDVKAQTGSERRGSTRRARRPERSRALYWSFGLLCAAVVGSALALGGLHPPVAIAAAWLVLVSTLLAIVSTRGPLTLTRPALLLFGFAGFTLLQALPLPLSWLSQLSPVAAEVWERSFQLRGSTSRFASISLDPGATLLEVAKWVMYGCAFIAASTFGAARNMTRAVLLPFLAAVLLALVTLAHGLTGASAVYGLYAPSFGPSPWHIGPLLNPNNLAGYLNLGLFCGLGLLVSTKSPVPRWLIGVGAAVVVPNAILAGSRGGAIGLLMGLVVFVALLPGRKRADPDFGPVVRSNIFLSVGAVLLAAAGFTALLGSEVTARELFGSNLDKFRLLSSTGPILRDFKLTGVGRGAFDGIFAAYSTRNNNAIYTHPENIVVQWAAEWGLVVGLLGLGLLCWTLRPSRLGQRWSATAAGVSAGLVALLCQNLVDFSLELPAVALCATVAAGACWGHARNGSRHGQSAAARFSVSRPVAMALVGVSFVLVCLGGWRGAHPVALERLELAEHYDTLAKAERSALTDFRLRVLRAVERHPAEPYFYRLGAVVARRLGEDPWPWVTRALERGPTAGRPQLLVAELVAERGSKSQALLELRFASLYEPALAGETARRAVLLTRDYQALVRAVPQGAVGAATLVAMANGLPDAKDQETRERLLREALTRDPDNVSALRRLAGELVSQAEQVAGSPRCRGEAALKACADDARRALAHLAKVAPQAAEPALLGSRLLIALGQPLEAMQLLAEQCGRLTGRTRAACLGTRLELNARHGGGVAFADAARSYLAENCAGASTCAKALEKIGDLSVRRGEIIEAMSFYDRASREAHDDDVWWKLADTAWKGGAPSKATAALARIHDKAKFEPRFSTLQQLLARGLIDIPTPATSAETK